MGDADLYDAKHRQLRGYWKSRIAAGHLVCCSRCGEPISTSQPFDLGHTRDRSQHSGPEHARSADCSEGGNRATSTHMARDRKRPQPPHPGAIRRTA